MNTIMRLARLMCALVFILTGPAWSAAQKPDFDRLFAEFDLVMLLIDPASGQIVDANAAAARFYGYEQAKLRSMTIQQINTFNPEQVAAERKLAASQGRNFFMFRHRLATNEVRTVEVHSRPFDFDGKNLLFSIVNDITPGRHQQQDLWHYQQKLEEMVEVQVRENAQRKRLQTAILVAGLVGQAVVIVWLVLTIGQRRRLERERETLFATLQLRNQELSRLGEVMAHHFQEPTRRLVSFAQRLLAKSDLAGDDDSRLSLNFIATESKRLSALVHDAQRYLALDHSKFATGESTSSAAALRHCMEAAGRAAADANIVLHEPLPRVQVTDKTLHELFAILLDNALRYRDPERPLRIEVSASALGTRAVFRFADNGSGIAPQYRAQVLGLFNRLVPSSVPGTGMGLALASKITHLAGGQLHVEDGLEGGACIVFDLPLEIAV
jgi:PAS domain S-box-containing protein